MPIINIIVEGKADKKFIEDYTFYVTKKRLTNFQTLGGYSAEAIRKAAPSFKPDATNLLIIDADYERNGGTFAKRKAKILALQTELNISFSLFLFPNNEEDGDLEELLFRIIEPKNADIFECWNTYESCLESKKKGYVVPAAKTKIYAYLEALVGKSKSDKELIKEEKRDYLNPNNWNLNSPVLNPLREFIEGHFGAETL
jgi:hypothetical protein